MTSLPRLAINNVLQEEARKQARWLADHKTLTHYRDGRDFGRRMNDIGWAGSSAENIASGQLTPSLVVTGWLGSPGHKKNMLGPYEQLGVGHAIDAGGRHYWVAIFGL